MLEIDSSSGKWKVDTVITSSDEAKTPDPTDVSEWVWTVSKGTATVVKGPDTDENGDFLVHICFCYCLHYMLNNTMNL